MPENELEQSQRAQGILAGNHVEFLQQQIAQSMFNDIRISVNLENPDYIRVSEPEDHAEVMQQIRDAVFECRPHYEDLCREHAFFNTIVNTYIRNHLFDDGDEWMLLERIDEDVVRAVVNQVADLRAMRVEIDDLGQPIKMSPKLRITDKPERNLDA